MPTSEHGEQTQEAAQEQGISPAQRPVLTSEPRRKVRNTGGLLRRLGLVVLLLAAGAFGYWRIRSNKQEENTVAARTLAAANRAIPVTVAPVISKTMPIYLTALGTVTAYNTVTIKSRVDGQLLSVNVREGEQVRQGQVLAMIDPSPYQAAVAQAEGQLAKDEAAAKNSKAEAGRYSALYQAGVVSKESAQVQISTADQSVGTLQVDRAAIQAAKVNVGYTRITSPINGVVGLRQVDAGNIVHAGDANGLLLVTQMQPIAVIFTLPEDQLPPVLKMLRNGQKLNVEAFDRSERTQLASGTLLTVDNQIDSTTGTVKAKAIFNNADGALFPNQFVNVRLVLEQRANSLVIPAAALQTGTSGTFVYLVMPGTPPKTADEESGVTATANPGANGGREKGGPQYYVNIQNVEVDLTEGSQIILKSGVKSGDQVVIDGQEKLRKYSKVDPKQGRSNAGGPSTQTIGAQGASANGSPQPSGPEQGTPEPHSSRGRSGSPSQHAGSQTGSQGGSER